MTFFTSRQERRLWLRVAVVVVAIYSTLGLAQSLAVVLRDFGMLSDLMWLSLFLMLAAIVIQGLKKRRSRIEIGVMLGIFGVYLLMFGRMAGPEERSHMIEYSVVAIFILEALRERARNGRRVRLLPLFAILATILIGTIDECIQLVLPSRVFDLFDILFDSLAAVMAVSASVALGWIRRRVEKLRERRSRSRA